MTLKYFKYFLLGALLFSLFPFPLYADFGCHFIVNSRLATPLDGGQKKLSFRFTCLEDMTLVAASLYCEEAQDPPGYLISVYSDDNGIPSAEPLGSSSMVPQRKSWFTVPFSNVPLFGGRVYHLVVEQDKNRGGMHPVGIIGPQNFASFAYTDFSNHMLPFDEAKDLKSEVLFFNGKSWQSLTRQPLYALHGGGQHTEGDPYDAFGGFPIYGGGTPSDKNGGVLQGEALHPHCHITPTGFAVRIRKQGNPKSPLIYKVYTNDYLHHITTFSYAGVAMPPEEAPSSFQWVTIGLKREDMAKPFETECTYVGFQTNSGYPTQEESGCGDCYLISEAGNSGGLSRGAEISFDGGAHLSRAAYSTDGGKTWFDKFEWDANIVILGPNCGAETAPVLFPIPTPLSLPKGLNQ